MAVFEKIGALWAALSPRERRLAVATAAALFFFVAWTAVQSSLQRLTALETEISQVQEEIVNSANQIAHKETVDALYGKVASQHSSAWTEAEIRDRLRQEVYRLSRQDPQGLDENGIPLNVPNASGNLVEIPSLGEGVMAEGGEGYRQYMLNLRIPSVDIGALVAFLERLQLSPQSLRIDKLEINRNPDSPQVTASIDITRTIVDLARTAAEEGGPALDGAPAEGRIPLAASEWAGDGCAVNALEAETGTAVEIVAEREGAFAEMIRRVPAGTVYEMNIDLSARGGGARLAVGLPGVPDAFPDPQALKGDGGTARYQVRFAAPEGAGETALACPKLLMDAADAVVTVHSLVLRKVSE
jgi:type II secretory pathway component PulM